MKLSATVTVLGLLPLALAESILVTFPSGTPDSVVDQAKQSVKDAGGKITHNYTDTKADSVQQLSTEFAAYNPTVEKDMTVTIQ
ncbi:similar to An07g10060 [Aspergillus luchuensis]|uniref:Similar to An07g10060 n=1 Tax=Aspergillus kawachii TaxID=1069201 RepID=A0A146F3H2_ASPKA|nr:similar to An07g10060 [Aspergillus luchuensis]